MKKRYIIYGLLIAMILVMIFAKPVLPTVQLPGETLAKLSLFGKLGFTNTFVATMLTWLVVLLLIIGVRARSRTADEVPSGFYNFFEMAIEMAYGFVEASAGKWAKQFFPWFMTFILVILIANWMELVPGVDSIGKIEDIGHHKVELAEEAAHEEGRELSESEIHAIEEEAKSEGGTFINDGPVQLLMSAEEGQAGQAIVPFVRAAATDLNFTLALALISVVMTQFYGFRANGLGYLSKFFTFNADKIKASPLSLMDTLVGILEFVSEISKILSFAFRLFGNIFAGQVLLFVIASLAAVANVGVFGLEFFVGAIQAAVFAMLTLTFMSQAVQTPHH